MNSNLNITAANSVVGRNSVAQSVRTLQVLGVPFWVEFGGVVYSSIGQLSESAITKSPGLVPDSWELPKPVEPQKAKPRRKKAQRNFRQTGYRNQLNQMKVGDKVQLPTTPYRPAEMQKAVCAVCHRMWGTGSYQTAIAGQFLEVLRLK